MWYVVKMAKASCGGEGVWWSVGKDHVKALDMKTHEAISVNGGQAFGGWTVRQNEAFVSAERSLVTWGKIAHFEETPVIPETLVEPGETYGETAREKHEENCNLRSQQETCCVFVLAVVHVCKEGHFA